jgi:hypothetical protein
MLRAAAYRSPWFLRAVALASLLGYLAGLTGMPVLHPFIGPDGKDLSRPFPCMHSHCGCQSAEACWRGCCCHTNRQKLAWAERNGVEPPDYVRLAAAAEPAATESCVGSCCDAPQTADTCCTTTDECCESQEQRPAWRFVCSLAARKCQGLPQLWLVMSAAAPMPPHFEWQAAEPEFRSLAIVSEACRRQSLLPATPPPRA